MIPQIKDQPQPIKDEVRLAFIDSLRSIWDVLIGVCVVGGLSSLMMKGLPLHNHTDKTWALKNTEGGAAAGQQQGDIEALQAGTVIDLSNPSDPDPKDDPKVISNDPLDMVAELTEIKEESDDPIDAVIELRNDRITVV